MEGVIEANLAAVRGRIEAAAGAAGRSADGVTLVAVSAGETVERGQVLVVLEAMKTVFRLTAPANKRVAAVSCSTGEMVQEGQVLVSFAEADD